MQKQRRLLKNLLGENLYEISIMADGQILDDDNFKAEYLDVYLSYNRKGHDKVLSHLDLECLDLSQTMDSSCWIGHRIDKNVEIIKLILKGLKVVGAKTFFVSQQFETKMDELKLPIRKIGATGNCSYTHYVIA